MTEHAITVEWNNGYRATCSCGRWNSKRYKVLKANARHAWEAHVRAVTKPSGCLRRREVAQ